MNGLEGEDRAIPASQDRSAALRAEPVAQSQAEPAATIAVTLVWASQGEYSDRREWPVVAYAEAADAEAAVLRIEALHRHLTKLYSARSDALWDAGDYSGATLYETEAEGRELLALIDGAKWSLGSVYDEVTLTCAQIEVRGALAKASGK